MISVSIHIFYIRRNVLTQEQDQGKQDPMAPTFRQVRRNGFWKLFIEVILEVGET
jgi:hypothetical protein